MKTNEKIDVNGTFIDCHIFIESRNSVRASITKKGLNIRVPIYLPPRERETQIERMKKWAIDELSKKPHKLESTLQNGKKLHLGENIYTLYLDPNLKKSFIDTNNIFIKTKENDTDKTIETKLLILIAPLFESWLKNIIPTINKSTINKPIKNIVVKNIHSKWGSCSSNGELVFSAKLYLQPLNAIYYVIIHELCHRIEMNHSSRFWALVSKYYPKYKDAKKVLKESKI